MLKLPITKYTFNYTYQKAQKMTKILLISEAMVKENSEISDNIWGKSLLPAIRTAQDIYLQQILGSCLYQKLLDLVDTGEITSIDNEAYKTLLDEYIQPFLIERTITDLVPIVASKIANLGVFTSRDEYADSVSPDEVDRLKKLHEIKADHYTMVMQNFLRGNRQAFPELECCGCGQIKPNLYSYADTGLWLGGRRNGKVLVPKH